MNPLLSIPLSREAFAAIESLTATGLYGATVMETAGRLLCERLRALAATGDLIPEDDGSRAFTVAELAVELGRPAHSLSRSLHRNYCPAFRVERGPTGRIVRLWLNPRLRAYLTKP